MLHRKALSVTFPIKILYDSVGKLEYSQNNTYCIDNTRHLFPEIFRPLLMPGSYFNI
jgi:hypothetical protein